MLILATGRVRPVVVHQFAVVLRRVLAARLIGGAHRRIVLVERADGWGFELQLARVEIGAEELVGRLKHGARWELGAVWAVTVVVRWVW